MTVTINYDATDSFEGFEARFSALDAMRREMGYAAYAAATDSVRADFAARLGADNGSFNLNPAQHAIVFEQAWADGHAEGLQGVQNAYIDLIDLADRLHEAR